MLGDGLAEQLRSCEQPRFRQPTHSLHTPAAPWQGYSIPTPPMHSSLGCQPVDHGPRATCQSRIACTRPFVTPQTTIRHPNKESEKMGLRSPSWILPFCTLRFLYAICLDVSRLSTATTQNPRMPLQKRPAPYSTNRPQTKKTLCHAMQSNPTNAFPSPRP